MNRVKANATNANRAVSQVMLPFPQKSAEVVSLHGPLKGRGAVTNLQGRYEVNGREHFDDGWTVPGAKDDAPAPLKTIVTDEIAKTILSRNTSPDIPFSVSLNPYRGCEHVNSEDHLCTSSSVRGGAF